MVVLAKKEDHKEVLEMAIKHSESLGLPVDMEKANKFVKNIIENKTVIVHESKKAMLAFVVSEWLLSDAYRTSVEVSFWVEPELRSQGVAGQLIDFYTSYCEGNKIDAITMAHMNDKYGTIAGDIYVKKGFKLKELYYTLEDK